jgi:hypothetical protein
MILLGVVVLATVLASFTDWLFMDLLVHGAYARMPQVWRAGGGTRRIVLSQVIGTVATAAVVLLCGMMPGKGWLVAAAVWCAGPLPVVAQYFQWMRMEPVVAASHAAGWLARVVIAAGLAEWLLPR